MKKFNLPENYKIKLNILNNIIYSNVRFNLYNDIYTINTECTIQANHNIILEKLYK